MCMYAGGQVDRQVGSVPLECKLHEGGTLYSLLLYLQHLDNDCHISCA